MGKHASPTLPSPFFSLLRKPAEHSSADCRFMDVCVSVAVFSAEKTSGRIRRCGGSIVRKARSFRRSETAIPRGR